MINEAGYCPRGRERFSLSPSDIPGYVCVRVSDDRSVAQLHIPPDQVSRVFREALGEPLSPSQESGCKPRHTSRPDCAGLWMFLKERSAHWITCIAEGEPLKLRNVYAPIGFDDGKYYGPIAPIPPDPPEPAPPKPEVVRVRVKNNDCGGWGVPFFNKDAPEQSAYAVLWDNGSGCAIYRAADIEVLPTEDTGAQS